MGFFFHKGLVSWRTVKIKVWWQKRTVIKIIHIICKKTPVLYPLKFITWIWYIPSVPSRRRLKGWKHIVETLKKERCYLEIVGVDVNLRVQESQGSVYTPLTSPIDTHIIKKLGRILVNTNSGLGFIKFSVP